MNERKGIMHMVCNVINTYLTDETFTMPVFYDAFRYLYKMEVKKGSATFVISNCVQRGYLKTEKIDRGGSRMGPKTRYIKVSDIPDDKFKEMTTAKPKNIVKPPIVEKSTESNFAENLKVEVKYLDIKNLEDINRRLLSDLTALKKEMAEILDDNQRAATENRRLTDHNQTLTAANKKLSEEHTSPRKSYTPDLSEFEEDTAESS